MKMNKAFAMIADLASGRLAPHHAEPAAAVDRDRPRG
jgi:hypothetical protein